MHSSTSPYRSYLKPFVDRLAAAVLLVLCAPVLAAIALIVAVKLGRPVLFTQARPGKNGRPFQLVKFRTMTDARDDRGQCLPDCERLTPFGQWLRSTSIDELPELWNVLRGEMSFVGPRPLLEEYLPLYSPLELRRHELRPGITGWAQVNGRNAISWEQKFGLDVWYVDHCGFLLDATILFMTLFGVIRRDGINSRESATTETLTKQRRSVVVLGAGGHAKVVISALRAAGWHVAAAFDDDPAKHGRRVLGVAVRGAVADAERHGHRKAVIAIGNQLGRSSVAASFPLEWISVVHPAATVDPTVTVGAGTVVCAGAVIQPDSCIGRHAIVNTSASVDHDCSIGDFAHIGPGVHLAGGVTVGKHALLGTGSCAVPGVAIGHRTIVGAGAVVVSDLPDDVVAIGCPAKVARKLSEPCNAA